MLLICGPIDHFEEKQRRSTPPRTLYFQSISFVIIHKPYTSIILHFIHSTFMYLTCPRAFLYLEGSTAALQRWQYGAARSMGIQVYRCCVGTKE